MSSDGVAVEPTRNEVESVAPTARFAPKRARRVLRKKRARLGQPNAHPILKAFRATMRTMVTGCVSAVEIRPRKLSGS